MTPEQIEFNKKWIAALRSGEHKQGKRALCRGDAFCCLGLAAKIAGCESKPSVDRDLTTFVFQTEDGIKFEATGVPPDIWFIETTGLCGSFKCDLYLMNDIEGRTFEEIAEVIEKKLPSVA